MATTPQFELYAFWRSSATFRVRVALAMKGMLAHEHFVNMDAGEQHSPAYRAINPLAAIPTLVEPGHVPITQSLAILEFLEETQPVPPLLPADRHGRARVRAIAGMLVADTHPLITPRIRKYLGTTSGYDDAAWRAWQTLVCNRSARRGTTPGVRASHRHFLPRRPGHHGRYLPGQCGGGHARVEH